MVHKCTTTIVLLKNVGIWKVDAALARGPLIPWWKRTCWGETLPCKRYVTAAWESKHFEAVADSLIHRSQKKRHLLSEVICIQELPRPSCLNGTAVSAVLTLFHQDLMQLAVGPCWHRTLRCSKLSSTAPFSQPRQQKTGGVEEPYTAI